MIKYYSLFFFLFINLCYAQLHVADIQHIHARIEPHIQNKSLKGSITLKFKALTNTDSIFLDGVNMNASLIAASTDTKINTAKDKIWFKGNYLKDKVYTISFHYSAKPKKAFYFVGFDDNDVSNDQIFTQGQGKNNSNWLPSIDNVNDKIEFDISIVIPNQYGALANGKLIEQWQENDSLKSWHYDMQKPMSSYLVAISVGDYRRRVIKSSSGIPLENYLLQKDTTYFEPTYRYTKDIFDYMERKIGVPYPWQNYKQVPVKDFLYAGMENTSLTIFSDRFVVDSVGFTDRNYVNVNAHELAHQWFGNLVTAKDSKHHWLQEGFATYYALLAERNIFGESYFYHKMYESAETLKLASDNGKGEKLLKEKASSLTYYQKGAWTLFMLNHLVGEKVFDEAVKNYLNKYAYQNVTTDSFMNEIKNLTTIDLTNFENKWLNQSVFQAKDAITVLQSSLFIQKYFELISKRKQKLDLKYDYFKKIFQFPVNEYFAEEVINQLSNHNMDEKVVELQQLALKTNNLKIRQAISKYVTHIPPVLKKNYETLLADNSYQTKENALYNLWSTFENDRTKYLEQTKGLIGFRDKNIQLLWLTLNLATPNYQPNKTKAIYKALEKHTNPEYNFEIRQHAFGYLYQINSFSNHAIKNLINGAVHYTWRFKNFCRQLIQKLLKDSIYKEKIINLKNQLTQKEINFLDKVL